MFFFSIDENNYNANKNLGILYHNLGVETIMKELPVDADLGGSDCYGRKAVNYFTKSLPYLKKVYKIEPTDEAIVHGMLQYIIKFK